MDMSTPHLFPEEERSQPKPVIGQKFVRSAVSVYFDRAENQYAHWAKPTCIISDGPYGVGGFPGDNNTVESLAEWYKPHIKVWSESSTPETTLWFWNTEIGWATVHPILAAYDWEYRCCNIWDKGLGHIAGNANTQTLRKFPVVTEVCAHYVKAARFQVEGKSLTMQKWLRHEWIRTGLTLRQSNEACGVLNAATRKYLTSDHLWYYPPVETFMKLVSYANEHGNQNGRPYFSINGKSPVSADQWAKLRAKFKCDVGVTNVWHEPQVSGSERIQGVRNRMKYKFRSLHGSQKPLKFINLIIQASSAKGDVVWEPFGGLCPGAVVSYLSTREYYATEVIPEFYTAAVERLTML